MSIVDVLEVQRWNRRTLHARAVYFHEQENDCAYDDCPHPAADDDDVCLEHRAERDYRAERMRTWRAREGQ